MNFLLHQAKFLLKPLHEFKVEVPHTFLPAAGHLEDIILLFIAFHHFLILCNFPVSSDNSVRVTGSCLSAVKITWITKSKIIIIIKKYQQQNCISKHENTHWFYRMSKRSELYYGNYVTREQNTGVVRGWTSTTLTLHHLFCSNSTCSSFSQSYNFTEGQSAGRQTEI